MCHFILSTQSAFYTLAVFYTQSAIRSPQSAVHLLYLPDIQPCDVLSGSFSSIQPISFPEAEIL